MRVRIYPELTYAELGAKRWQISWEELKPSASAKQGEDVDYDRDIQFMYAAYATEQKARESAQKILDAGKPYFGAITLVQQTVDWFVEEDRVAEWRDCGQSEEIS